MDDLELRRQQRLAHHYLLDAGSAARLHDTVELAATAVGFPHAQVNVLDDVLQYTISDFAAGGQQAMPRRDSMCHHTVLADALLAVGDLRRDTRSRDLPGVRAGAAASYLGVPLHSREATPVGTLCFFDTQPREITDEQKERSQQFGRIVEGQLDLIRRAREQRLQDQTTTADLAHAIQREEITPWFQPIVDLGTDQVVGYEALARWRRPDGRTEDPARFIPQAEDSDLVVDLDRVVTRRALEHFARWSRTRPDLRLNINLSTRHLEIPDGVTVVHEAVLAAGVSPGSVSVELTESRSLADEATAHDAVSRFRGLGYRVVLDDFGSGWSSLDWILRLPIDGIKVDRALTSAMGSPTGDAITRALISLTRELDLDVVVEGISTAEHAQLARELGYRRGQGYYWATPRAPEAIDPCAS
jgi:EAL domain-containing protein (putative c-di-GMP-specific phosphodiesterase class I)